MSNELNHAQADLIRQALGAIVASREFRSTKRCQDLLKYLVEAKLSDGQAKFKERTIALDVFGVNAEFEPSDSSIVRVRACELRKRLERYYENEGKQSSIRIAFHGSYIPEFSFSQTIPILEQRIPPSLPAAQKSSASELVPPRKPRKSHRRWLAAMAVFVLVVGIFGVMHAMRERTDALSEFWTPVVNTPTPVLLFVAPVPVYSLNHNPISTSHVVPAEFELVKDQYVATSDVGALFRVAGVLKQLNQPYRLHIGSMSFADLRGEPAVAIGYTYSRLKEVSNNGRYRIRSDEPPFGILDRSTGVSWVLPNSPNDPALKEDYAIIARSFQPDTQAPLVELAGISHFGTEAAGELVTNGKLLRSALERAPKGWERQNLQIVIHVKVIDGYPSAPEVMATYFW